MSNNGTKPAVQLDPHSLLRRADREWVRKTAAAQAEPEYLTHLATYLARLLAGTLEPDTAVDERELAELRGQVAAAERTAAGHGAEADRLRAENTDLHAQLRAANEALNELATARSQIDALTAQLEQANDDNARLADQTADQTAELEQLRATAEDTTKLIGKLRADYDTVQKQRDRLADQLAAATVHVCTYPWPDPNGPKLPCSCGRPFPRYTVLADDDVAQDLEPWDALFDRIRAEIGRVEDAA